MILSISAPVIIPFLRVVPVSWLASFALSVSGAKLPALVAQVKPENMRNVGASQAHVEEVIR